MSQKHAFYFLFALWVGITVAPAVQGGPMADDLPEVKNPTTQSAAFARFPEGKPVAIGFEVDEDILDPLSPRERADQLRDWMLFAVVSDAGLSVERLNQCLFDLPVLRPGYLRPVFNLDYGATRSRNIGEGRVIALIPEERDLAKRDERLRRIADDYRNDQGEKPARVFVFEYRIDPAQQKAIVTQRRTIDGGSLFEPAQGYVEARITAKEDLKGFLEQIDDVTFARSGIEGLTLGGRRIEGRKFRAIRPEDAAALWQAQKKVHTGLARFEERWSKEFKEFEARWNSKSFATSEALERAKREASREQSQLVLKMLLERNEQKLVDGLGFSLDPAYDHAGLAELLVRFGEDVRRLRSGKVLPIEEVRVARTALSQKDRAAFQRMIERLSKTDGMIAGMLRDLFSSAEEQLRDRGDLDYARMSASLGELGPEIQRLTTGPEGELAPAKLEVIRSAIARHDESPLRALIGQLGDRRGLAARSLHDALDQVLLNSHARGVLDFQRLSAFLARVGGELEGLATDLSSERVESARAAAARKDAAPFLAMLDLLGQRDTPVARVVREALISASGRYLAEGKDDYDGLVRYLDDFQESVEMLFTGGSRLLSVKDIDDVRAGLARRDEGSYLGWVNRLDQAPTPLARQVGHDITRSSQSFRACDFASLTAQMAKFATDLPAITADASPLSAKAIHQVQEALGKHNIGAFENWTVKLIDFEHPLYLGFFAAIVEADRKARSFDYESLAGLLQDLEGRLKGPATDGWLPLDADIEKARGAAAKGDEVPFLVLVDGMRKTKLGPVPMMLGEALSKAGMNLRFQAARYDGDLQGTEVAMVMFYTDLLAKLWALDFHDSAPSESVPEFKPLTAVKVSSIYRQESEQLPNTRLWFGPRENGYQLSDQKRTLLFARNSTRIYAASSNPLRPGHEEPPSAASDAFLGWWNDRYEEVAAFEPEYQRLNEVMKWTLLLSWLDASGRLDSLSFLADAPVDHKQWFPDWARSRNDLTFHAWDRVGFYSRGHKGAATESLPRLLSRHFESFDTIHQLSGGVSGGSVKLIEERAALSRALNPLIRRSGIDAESALVSKGKVLRSLRGGEFKIGADGTNRATVIASPNVAAKFRSTTSEVFTKSIGTTIARDEQGLGLTLRADSNEVARVDFRPTENGFTVGVRKRVLIEGQDLARKMSRSFDAGVALRGDPSIEMSIRLPDARGFLVKVRDANDWMLMAPERRALNIPTPQEAHTWDIRVADTTGGAHGLDVAVIDRAKVEVELARGEYIRVAPMGETGQGFAVEVNARGPPAKAQPFEAVDDVSPLKGQFEPSTGSLYIRIADLPESLRHDPIAWKSLIKQSDFARIKELAARTGEGKVVEIPKLASNGAREAAEAVSDVDGLLASRKYVQASHRLDDLEAAHGTEVEWRIRKALADLGRDREGGRSMMETLTGKRQPGEPEVADFLKEINQRMDNPGLGEKARGNLRRVAELTDWQHQLAKGAVTPGDLIGFVEGEGSIRKGFVFHSPLVGEAVDPGMRIPVEAELFIQDDPLFNSLDINHPVDQVIHTVIEGRLGDVKRLTQEDIAHFRPDRVYEPVGPGNGDGGFPNGGPSPGGKYRSYHRVRSYHPSSGPSPRGFYRPYPQCDNDDDRDPNVDLPRDRGGLKGSCNKTIFYVTTRGSDER
ncbi:MAG: hypothetical protein ACLQGP_28910 [Isosphaeraceae bacterium]